MDYSKLTISLFYKIACNSPLDLLHIYIFQLDSMLILVFIIFAKLKSSFPPHIMSVSSPSFEALNLVKTIQHHEKIVM